MRPDPRQVGRFLTALVALWVTAVASAAPLPTDLAHPRWTAPLPSWANGSPTVVGNKVFVTSEPTTLVAVDRTTGAVLWSGRHDYVDTLSDEARTAFEADVAAYDTLQERFRTARLELSAAQRAARSKDPPADLQQTIATLAREVTTTQAQLDAFATFLTPDDKSIIGYASPTPASDGTVVAALFGHGVVGVWTVDGTLRWRRWLGPPPTPMKGYDEGSTASPAIAGDVLIVAQGRLRGLDLRTGETLWEGPEWRHFGSPVVTRVGSTDVVLTPDGRILRARDGAQLDAGMGDLLYTHPVVVGDVAVWMGNHTAPIVDGVAPAGHAWRLVETAPGTVKAEALWVTKLADAPSDVYTPPVCDGKRLYVVLRYGTVYVIDLATGRILDSGPSPTERGHAFYATAVVGDRHLVVTASNGQIVRTPLGPTLDLQLWADLSDTLRATPRADRGDLLIRTSDALVAYGPAAPQAP